MTDQKADVTEGRGTEPVGSVSGDGGREAEEGKVDHPRSSVRAKVERAMDAARERFSRSDEK